MRHNQIPAATLPVQQERDFRSAIFGIGFVLVFTLIAFLLLRQTAPINEKAGGFYDVADAGGVNRRLVATNAPQEYASAARALRSEATNIGSSASSAVGPSTAALLADMSTSPVNVTLPDKLEPKQFQGVVLENIKYATKGDGQIRPVAVNGQYVDSDFVKLAMFENQDYMYHLETPISKTPHLQDPNYVPQKSMFRKMTYPLVWQGGPLGMDVIGNRTDSRVTISFTGGRPPLA